MNPLRSKLISLIEHKASPPITGIRDKLTYNPVCSPRNAKLDTINYNHNKWEKNYSFQSCVLYTWNVYRASYPINIYWWERWKVVRYSLWFPWNLQLHNLTTLDLVLLSRILCIPPMSCVYKILEVSSISNWPCTYRKESIFVSIRKLQSSTSGKRLD